MKIVAGLLLAILFLFGIVHLLMLRFEAGDVYPYYSSFRSDPLGTKALYESLNQCCGLKVRRNFEPFAKRKEDTGAAILFLGVEVSEVYGLPEDLSNDLDYFIRNGGRLVVTFLPPKSGKHSPEEVRKTKEKMKEVGKQGKLPKWVSLPEHWRFGFQNISLPPGSKANLVSEHRGFPSAISCDSATSFTNPEKRWKVLYARDGHPVIMERDQGRGSIVLSSLNYFVSNEALVKERHPELLAWLAGTKSEIIFDEYHHGVLINPGVATLIRKYRLEWLVLGLFVLAALFVWQSAAPLVPPFQDQPGGVRSLARGKDSASGLINLLRRNVPYNQILFVCFDQWKKSAGNQAVAKNKLERINSMIDSQRSASGRQRKPLETYNAISGILKDRG